MLDFNSFKTDTATIELRFAPSFLMWDRSGALWTEIQSRFPELKYSNVQPSQQVFESKTLRVMLELESLRVITRGQGADKRVADVSEAIFRLASDKYKISTFTRLGFRDLRSQIFESKEDALSASKPFLPSAMAANLLPDAKIQHFQCAIRQEADNYGLNTSLRVEEREVKVAFPWEVAEYFPTMPPKETVIVLDSDYYTIGTTERDSLNLEEWGKQASRTAKRYWNSVLG